jgi:hypothetical protein
VFVANAEFNSPCAVGAAAMMFLLNSAAGQICRIAIAVIALGASADEQQSQTHPSGKLRLGVVVSPVEPERRRLTISREGTEVGSIVVPPRVSKSAIDQELNTVLWHQNGNDVAVGFKGDQGSFVVVFLKQPDGRYVAVDVSRVEAVNIGAIGPDRTYRDVHTVPMLWLPREDDSVQLSLQTRAWALSGQRYVMAEPLIITRDGRPLWR